MWRPDPRSVVLGVLVAASLSSCIGVDDKHSTVVQQVPVKLVFTATPSPSPSGAPAATPSPRR